MNYQDILIPKIMLVRDHGYDHLMLNRLNLTKAQLIKNANVNQNETYRRRIYLAGEKVYKVWGEHYYLRENILGGIKSGLLGRELASALVGVIFNQEGLCRGYWMWKVELSVQPSVFKKFTQTVGAKEKETRCKFTDFHKLNVGMFRGQPCLLDLENCELIS